jgi:hypothetical protein
MNFEGIPNVVLTNATVVNIPGDCITYSTPDGQQHMFAENVDTCYYDANGNMHRMPPNSGPNYTLSQAPRSTSNNRTFGSQASTLGGSNIIGNMRQVPPNSGPNYPSPQAPRSTNNPTFGSRASTPGGSNIIGTDNINLPRAKHSRPLTNRFNSILARSPTPATNDPISSMPQASPPTNNYPTLGDPVSPMPQAPPSTFRFPSHPILGEEESKTFRLPNGTTVRMSKLRSSLSFSNLIQTLS